MADALHRHSELSASDGTPDRALVVDSTGRVGINTASPTSLLELNSGDIEMTTGYTIRWGSPTSDVHLTASTSTDVIRLGTVGGDLVLKAGDVGIGIDSPSVKLDVAGGVKVSSGVDVGDAGGFSGIKWNAASSRLEFWLDGFARAAVLLSGTYQDLW